MVNYRYDLADIERNHEAYAAGGTRQCRAVRGLLRSLPKTKGLAAVPDLLALPGRFKDEEGAPVGFRIEGPNVPRRRALDKALSWPFARAV